MKDKRFVLNGIPPSGRNYSDRKPIGRMQVAEKNRAEWISGRMEISSKVVE